MAKNVSLIKLIVCVGKNLVTISNFLHFLKNFLSIFREIKFIFKSCTTKLAVLSPLIQGLKKVTMHAHFKSLIIRIYHKNSNQ